MKISLLLLSLKEEAVWEKRADDRGTRRSALNNHTCQHHRTFLEHPDSPRNSLISQTEPCSVRSTNIKHVGPKKHIQDLSLQVRPSFSSAPTSVCWEYLSSWLQLQVANSHLSWMVTPSSGARPKSPLLNGPQHSWAKSWKGFKSSLCDSETTTTLDQVISCLRISRIFR